MAYSLLSGPEPVFEQVQFDGVKFLVIIFLLLGFDTKTLLKYTFISGTQNLQTA